MNQEKTLTVLENCVVAFAREGVAKTGNSMVTGLINQLTPAGRFQASKSFSAFDADVQRNILEVARKIAEAEASAEQQGVSSLTEPNPLDRPKAGLSITLEGYEKSTAPKDGKGPWWNSFIITKVTLVNASALVNAES